MPKKPFYNSFFALTSIAMASALSLPTHAQEPNDSREDTYQRQTEYRYPPAVCGAAETRKKEKRREYLERMKQNVCDSVDTSPNIKDSILRFVSPEANSCNFDMSLPGLPSLSSMGVDTCGKLDEITGGLAGDLNNGVMGGINNALDKLEEETGIDAGDLNTSAEEIAGQVDDFTGLGEIKNALEQPPADSGDRYNTPGTNSGY